MVDVPAIRGRLAQAARSVRAAMNCLGGGVRDSQEYSTKALLVLSEILDLLSRIRDQVSWAEEKWIVEQSRLNGLNELLRCFESSVRAIEIYFQPGGVGVRSLRKGLLERTFLPRLEKFKVVFLVAMQPDSREKLLTEQQLRSSLRQCRDMEPAGSRPNSLYEDDFHNITSPVSTRNFITLADMCNRRQQGTCQWIFDEEKYKSWLFGCSRSLYFIGPAGAGKTFLASSVIDNLQRTFTTPDVAIVFMFCNDEKEDDQSSTTFLANILAQLVYCKRTASHTTAALYRSESFATGNASAKTYQNAIRAEVNRFSKVFFVIDGLDTLSEKDRILNRLQKLPEHAQLLITLREAKYDHKDGFIPVIAHRQDLENYVGTRINQDEGLMSLLKQYSTEYQLKEAIIQQVVERSHGLFLLARMHMDLLARCNDANLLQRALLHLPGCLNDAYGESMKHLASQNLYASRCIYWTLYAYRPLTVAELKSAALFEPQNGAVQKETKSFEHILLIETAGLLTVDPMTGTVHLIHKTAKEYLTGTVARVFFPTARKHIAETCLTVITSDEVVDDCYINQGTTPRNSNGSLLSYAATYWGFHARDVPEEEQTTQVLIRAFLNKLSWRRPPARDDYVIEMGVPKQLGLGKYFSDWTALHVLAFFGITGKAKRLIEQGADVNAQENYLGITPLHCAAHRGNEEMVELLLSNKANINAICKEGNTALHMAAQHGQRKVIKTLLARRVNSRMPNRNGATALQATVGTANDEAIVPLLIKTRFDMDTQNLITGNTALHLAVEYKQPRILLFLLEKGASMNLFNRQGLTPLQLAAKTDNCEALSLLLDRGAQVEARSLSGSRALHIAALEGNWVAFDLLLIGGADINAWDNDGESLLHEQARKASNTSIAAYLLEQGTNIEARTSQGYTPIQCAAMSGNKEMFFFLFAKGAKIDVETPKGETLLHITPPSNEDCIEIIKTVLEYGVNVHAVSTDGWTALHQTVFTGTGALDIALDKTSDYIQLLLSHGANPNAVAASATGETPLHLAAMASMPRPSLVSFLIKCGASVNTITNEGKTPLHLAAERGRDTIFQILLQSGGDLTIRIPTSAIIDDSETDCEGGDTPLDLARKNPLGALWFDELGNLQLISLEKSQRGSLATTIEEPDIYSETDDAGGTTLVEDDEEGGPWYTDITIPASVLVFNLSEAYLIQTQGRKQPNQSAHLPAKSTRPDSTTWMGRLLKSLLASGLMGYGQHSPLYILTGKQSRKFGVEQDSCWLVPWD
ncbi:hypothetical protein MW887_006850 [Aspergillus wentii]|nr:hypothetical protein MW887_006850 [Aspergillus wentii]